MLRDEMDGLPEQHRNHPYYKLIFDATPTHAIRTKTERKPWHQRLCHFSPSLIAQAHECCEGVPELRGDTSDPVIDQCSACMQAKLERTHQERKVLMKIRLLSLVSV